MKEKVAVAAAAFVIGLGVMYYARPASVEKTAQTETRTEKDKRTVTRETTRPDGTRTRVTTINSTTRKNIDAKTAEKTTYSERTTSVQLLVSPGAASPLFGVHITRRVLGPVNVGAFGFQDGRFGASIGLSF